MNFESKLEELDLLIKKLESGEVGFDEASKMYEDGAQLAKDLLKNLEMTKGKVSVIRDELNSLIEENID